MARSGPRCRMAPGEAAAATPRTTGRRDSSRAHRADTPARARSDALHDAAEVAHGSALQGRFLGFQVFKSTTLVKSSSQDSSQVNDSSQVFKSTTLVKSSSQRL
jgi:hypothetical protein